MALQFSETAPGVHTTTLVDPKTERRHNVAIIESCDAWQLFIDGELRTRDLPSFKAAVAAAQAQVMARRSASMVRVATALVAVSVAGAATIGLSKAISPLLGGAITVVKVASDTKSARNPQRFKRVTKPPKATVVEAAPSKAPGARPAAQAAIDEALAKVTPPAQLIALPTKQAQSTAAGKREETGFAAAGKAITPGPEAGQEAGHEIAPMGLQPLPMPAVKKPQTGTQPVPDTSQNPETAPVINWPKGARSATETPSEKNQELAADDEASPALPTEALPTASNEAGVRSPPLPVRAPVVTVPLIRSASAPIDRGRLNSILSDIEEKADDSEYAPQRRKAAKRPRRSNRHPTVVRQYRHIRHKPVYTARAHRVPLQRRMTCFAHTCRFR